MEESIKKIKMDQWIYEDDDKATVRMNLLAITINLKSKDNLKFSKKPPKKQKPPPKNSQIRLSKHFAM